MDKNLLKEIIKEFEQISVLVNNRLSQLYSLLGEETNCAPQNNIKSVIDQQREEMLKKVEDMRKQAMEQVQNSMKNAGVNSINNLNPMNNMMPGIGPPIRSKDE